MLRGEFSSVELVNVFGAKCQETGRNLYLTTEENFFKALQMANDKDQERRLAKQSGTQDELPLLHGIPFAVHDQISQQGFLCTMGCAILSDQRQSDNAAILQMFID